MSELSLFTDTVHTHAHTLRQNYFHITTHTKAHVYAHVCSHEVVSFTGSGAGVTKTGLILALYI